jgi:hypothetical protein
MTTTTTTTTTTTLPTSDLPISDQADILTRLAERIADAEFHGDGCTARRLGRAFDNIAGGAGVAWALGELLVESLNHPGVVYTVTTRGCNCRAGAHGLLCWHGCVRDTLIELAETAAETADMRAECAA